MTEPRWVTSKDAKENGWFSRRHENSDANRDAREYYRDHRSKKARRERAYARGADRPKGDAA